MNKMELAVPEKGRHRALKSSEIRKIGGMQPPNPAVQHNEDEDAGKTRLKATVHIHPGLMPADKEPQKDRVKISKSNQVTGTETWWHPALG